jgi:dTDP-4-amino-4,6-dideoxygalactose transaminase
MNNEWLPFSRPSVGPEEIQAVVDTLSAGWLTTGPRTKEFEAGIARYIGCRNVVAMNSCTAALHLALEAIGLRAGDAVITTPMTFAATAETIRYFNADPILVDVDRSTLNINPAKIEEFLRSRAGRARRDRIKAIIPVHYAGYPCDMDEIMRIANAHGLTVVEDAAHAFPAVYKDTVVGNIGHITCFSFYATKNITTGEGGAAVTGNDEWANRMRIMSLHGISRDAWKRYTSEGSWYYEIAAPGFKYNLTDVAASLGIVQLRKANEFWARRSCIARQYNEAFRSMDELETPFGEGIDDKAGASGESSLLKDITGTRHSWHLYILRLVLGKLEIDRDKFIDELKGMGIGTSVHFIPLHIHPYYRETYGYKPGDYPISYGEYQRIVSLPIYPRMSDADVDRVIKAVTDVVHRHQKRKSVSGRKPLHSVSTRSR